MGFDPFATPPDHPKFFCGIFDRENPSGEFAEIAGRKMKPRNCDAAGRANRDIVAALCVLCVLCIHRIVEALIKSYG